MTTPRISTAYTSNQRMTATAVMMTTTTAIGMTWMRINGRTKITTTIDITAVQLFGMPNQEFLGKEKV